jgi:integrase
MVIDYSTFNTGFDGRIFVTLGRAVKTDYGNPENMEMLKKVNYVRYRQDVSDAIQVYNKFHKTEFSTHDFRRCFARRFWNKYKDMQALKSVLNHANIYTTARYLEQSGLANVEYHKEMQKDTE